MTCYSINQVGISKVREVANQLPWTVDDKRGHLRVYCQPEILVHLSRIIAVAGTLWLKVGLGRILCH